MILWLFFPGGNAGMAAAYAARKMGVPATIIVPSSSPQTVVQKLQDQGAAVKIIGKVEYDNIMSRLTGASSGSCFFILKDLSL